VIAESQSDLVELVELSEDELDDVVGAGSGLDRYHLGDRRCGKLAKSGRKSGSSFQKHSLSITGQTITNADGSSVTSFSIQEEYISSNSFESSDD
jgi:hypothetical protein